MYGHSHGGYNVYQQVAHHPDIWAGAVASAGFADLLAHDKDRRYPHLHRYLGDPEENATAWREQSPIEHVSETTVPLLMVHGTDDPVSIEQPRQFAQVLREHGWAEGEDFLLVELDGIGHVSKDSREKQERWRPIIDFLETWI